MGRGVWLSRVVGGALLSALLLAAPASAGTPFTVGQGNRPDVAVGSDGAASIVWQIPNPGGDDPIGYCKVPRGATKCVISKTLNAPLDAIGHQTYVFVNGSTVQIVSGRCCNNDNVLFTSTDGGNSFSTPVEIGDGDVGAAIVQGPGAGFSGFGFNPISLYQFMPAGGPQTTTRATLPPGFPIPVTATMALHGGTTPVAVWSDGESKMTFSRYSGTGDLNDAANWTAPAPLNPPGVEIAMASGANGPALLFAKVGTPGKFHWQARKFDGSTFGPGVDVTETGVPLALDAAGDPSGRVTALWIDNGQPNKLKFSQSSDGVKWSTPVVVTQGTEPDLTFSPQVGSGPDGQGFAVYEKPGNGGPAAADIRAVPLQFSGDSTGPEQPTKVDTGDQVLTLFTPKQCQPRGAKIRVHVTSTAKRKLAKGQGRSKILFVDFLLDKVKKLHDTKAAFRTKIDSSGLRAGTRHTLTARIQLQQLTRGKKKFSKQLNGRLSIC